MPVLTIKPASGRQGDFGLVADSSCKRQWVITTSSKLDSEIYIRNYGQSNTYLGQRMLPIPYTDQHPEMPSFICKNLSLQQRKDSPLVWDATATYSTQPISNLDLQAQEAPDPILRPAEIGWSTTTYQKAALTDINGKPIVNSAGDPFNPPVMLTYTRIVASVSKNLLTVPSYILDYENAVNSDSFTIDGIPVAAQKARLSGVTISPLKREKITTGVEFYYRTVTFRIEFTRETYGWKLRILDQGFRYKDPADSTKRIPIPEDGSVKFSRPVTSPRLLDGSGNVLANPTANNAAFLNFDAYPLKPFNGVLPLA